ncbi:unnamed protein product [Urochloa humidicola]
MNAKLWRTEQCFPGNIASDPHYQVSFSDVTVMHLQHEAYVARSCGLRWNKQNYCEIRLSFSSRLVLRKQNEAHAAGGYGLR